MKLWLMLLMALACMFPFPSRGLNIGEENFVCPIDDNKWHQLVAKSGTSWGIRLDYRPFGPTASPWTLPQCPKCGFVLYEKDVEKIPVEKLRPYILSDAFSSAARGKGPYFALALINEHLGASQLRIGWAYLSAAWQNEANPNECRECLNRALTHFTAARADVDMSGDDFIAAWFISGELERRLGHFKTARSRFEEMRSLKEFHTTGCQTAILRELRFVAQKDALPHAMIARDEKLFQRRAEW